MVAVVNRSPRSIAFPVYEFNSENAITGCKKSIIVYGYTDKRNTEESLLINNGTARITYLEDAEWEGIKTNYSHLTELKLEVIYAMPKEKDAKVKAKELIENYDHLQMSHLYRKQQGEDLIQIEEVV